MSHQKILTENGFVAIPASNEKLDQSALATLLSNIAYYGFALTESAYLQLTSVEGVEEWWKELEVAFKSFTGADKNMGDFIVYKNFPRETLEMSQTEYWIKQILMYWGFPNEYFTEDVESRELKKEKLPLKVLQPANNNSLSEILNSLLQSPVKWTPRQKDTVEELLGVVQGDLDISNVPFKENMVALALMLINRPVSLGSATDVLRLAACMSDGDISLKTNTKLRRFKRSERRFLMGLLESCRNLDEDVARRREHFKRLFFELRPGDYRKQYPNVVSAYDKAYRGAKIETFNSSLEQLLKESDPKALNLLKTRPGEFLRRLRIAINKYGYDAVKSFREVMPRLTVHQLLKMERQVLTVNNRSYRTFAPKGNWTKLQVVKMRDEDRWDENIVAELSDLLADEIGRRVSKSVPAVKISQDMEKVKLQGSDADLSPYGRGTIFDIPKNITFLRSASYWKTGGDNYNNIWFDNGWNFFDKNWSSVGVCCWNRDRLGDAAIFSGDPTNSKELEGRACQMIDLYLDKLEAYGVRYAVWNILCYSHKSFDDAEDVHAALQWGEKPQANNLFEPSRCVLSFPMQGNNMTKYIAYVNVVDRKLVYMDANLYGEVSSAASNAKTLETTMPVFLEYLNSLPSISDLFKRVPISESGVPVVYDDTDEPVTSERAYVFLRRNKNSTFDPLDLNMLLKE